MTEIFLDKSAEVGVLNFPRASSFTDSLLISQLRDAWTAEITKQDGVCKVEALGWLSKTTLNIIGTAGKSLLYSRYPLS